MKMQNVSSTLMGIKSSDSTFEGKTYSSTTFYLPADVASSATTKALGSVTVPYKLGDATEFNKWGHLEKSWPATGIPVLCDFDIVQGRDANGRDVPKLVLTAIKPAPSAQAKG